MKKGFSLPLWLAVCAKAALKKLLGLPFENYEYIKIPNRLNSAKLKVHSAGFLNRNNSALAITFINSGLDLDLTNNLEIWTIATFIELQKSDKSRENLIEIVPGDGVGIDSKSGKICISTFAKEVLDINLLEMIPKGFKLRLEIIFPHGKFLAERTSNKSFGIVDGLSIIGTTAETHLSASPEQLKFAKDELDHVAKKNSNDAITFVIGENGFDLAQTLNIPFPIIKVGNWIGPLLVYAALKDIKKILLLGYYGKLIKLAGGIFHTHNHLADARIEILVYFAIKEKLPLRVINAFMKSNTIDEAVNVIEQFNLTQVKKLLLEISNQVEMRAEDYIKKYVSSEIKVGSVLFDRKRQIRAIGYNSNKMFSKICTFKT